MATNRGVSAAQERSISEGQDGMTDQGATDISLAHLAISSVNWGLAPGEHLLWQGRPDAWPVFTRHHLFTLARGGFALVLFVYILGRMNMGLSPYRDIQVIVFVLFFMSIPIDLFKSAFTRRISRYALTSQRAMVRIDMPLFGSRTLSVPILPDTRLDVLHTRRRTTILFAAPTRAKWDLRAAPARIGFERIEDGAAVLALLRKVQRAGTAPA